MPRKKKEYPLRVFVVKEVTEEMPFPWDRITPAGLAKLLGVDSSYTTRLAQGVVRLSMKGYKKMLDKVMSMC